MNRVVFTTVLIILICSCASTGVIPLGQNSYYLGKKDGTPGLGVSLENKAAVYKEAGEFCASKNLEMKVIKETVKAAVPARLGSTEIEFSCVPMGSLETPIETKPDQIIETRKR